MAFRSTRASRWALAAAVVLSPLSARGQEPTDPPPPNFEMGPGDGPAAFLEQTVGTGMVEEGKSQSAIAYLERACRWSLHYRGASSQIATECHAVLLKAYANVGNTAAAQKLNEQLKRGNEGGALLNKALAAYVQGDYDAAARDAAAGLALMEGAFGADSPSLDDPTDKLAGLYEERYEFAKAEGLRKKVLGRWQALQKKFPKDAVAKAMTLRALQQMFMHYSLRSSLDDAEIQAKAMLDLAQNGKDTDHVFVAFGNYEIASIRNQQKRYDEALAALDKALAAAAASGSPEFVSSMRNTVYGLYGLVQSNRGEHEAALDKVGKAVAQAEKDYGGDVARYRGLQHGWGWVLRNAGRYDEAIAAWEKVGKVDEAKFGPDYPDKHAILNPIAEAMWAAGRPREEIMDLALEASDNKERGLIDVLSAGSEAQRRDFAKDYIFGSDRIITYNINHEPSYLRATTLGLNTVLRRKGRVLDMLTSELRNRVDQLSGDQKRIMQELVDVRQRLATVTFRGPAPGQPREAHDAAVTELRDREDDLQRQLGTDKVLDAATDRSLITWQGVQSRIPADAVLVEIVQYSPFDVHYKKLEGAFGPPRYAAYILRATGDPRVVQLGDVAKIDAVVKDLRRAMSSPKRKNVKSVAAKLDDLVFQPLVKHFEGADHVLMSPDGHLNLVPFGALVNPKGKYELERFRFTYLTSGRDLLRMGSNEKPRSGPVLLGNPDFDLGGGGSDRASGTRASDVGSMTFDPLPGTKEELDALAKVLDDADSFTKAEATEGRLRDVSGPKILHIATHGFFLEDQKYMQDSTRGLEISSDAGTTPENPLLRSGLALAGANTKNDGAHDGIMTALELGAVDLHGTQLVVLSACETAVGEIDPGEGVYGLRRSLVVAGSETQVISLWQVSDDATRDLMIDFYARLDDGEGRSEALRAAQLKLLKKRKTAHPFYWAAFIPSGQWTAMGRTIDRPRRRSKAGKWTRGPGGRSNPAWGGARLRGGGGGGGGGFRDWMRQSVEEEDLAVVLSFGISRPFPSVDFEGANVDPKRGWSLGVELTKRSRFLWGFAYERRRFEAPDHPTNPDARINRFDARLGIDLIALPWDIKVRPALVGYAAGGLAWGKDDLTDVDTGERIETSRLGGAISGGADFALTFLLKEVLIGVRGGVAKPLIGYTSKDPAPQYVGDVGNGLRWTVGLLFGAVDD